MRSIAESMGHLGVVLYAIVKAAVDAVVRQLALEYALRGMRVMSVTPGLISTPALDNLGLERDRFIKKSGTAYGALHGAKRKWRRFWCFRHRSGFPS